jgi:2-hydroxychromene-2-carboxylate isomerase
VIGAIATELGIDPAPLVHAAHDPDVRADGVRALLDIDADGVFGVPFFVHGRARYWGLDRLPDVIAAVRGTAPIRRDTTESVDLDTTPAADLGHAGGCG